MPQYINSIKVKTGKFGLKVSGKLEGIYAELKQHVNENGYINLDFNPRKQPGKYGETHSVILDEWKPNQNPNIGGHSNATDWNDSPF